jgi:hypothetical protein
MKKTQSIYEFEREEFLDIVKYLRNNGFETLENPGNIAHIREKDDPASYGKWESFVNRVVVKTGSRLEQVLDAYIAEKKDLKPTSL